MVSLNLSLKETDTRKSLLAALIFILIGLTAWLVYYRLNVWLLDNNFANDLLLYFGERRSLLNLSTNGGIQNTLLVPPFVSYLPVLFFKNPLLAASFVGAVILTSLLVTLYRLYLTNQITALTAFLFGFNLIFNPGFLFLFAQDIHFAILAVFLAYTAYTLRKYYFERVSAFLLLFSICLAIMITNGLARYYLLLIFFPAVAIITYTQSRPLLPILMVVIFPTLFFVLINFSIQQLDDVHLCRECTPKAPIALTDNNNLFLASHGNYYIELIGKKHTAGFIFYTLKQWLHALGTNILLYLPYLAFFSRTFRYASKLTFLSIALIPLLYFLQLIYIGTIPEGVFIYFIFVIYSIIFYTKCFGIPFENELLNKIILRLSFVILFFAGGYTMLHSPSMVESNFTKAIFGLPFDGNLKSSKDLLQLIKRPGKILLDDTYLFRIVYLSQSPDKFILPFQPAFSEAINDPSKYVEYVVVSKFPVVDHVLSRYPSVLMGKLKGFHLVKEVDDAFLFERNSEEKVRR